MRFHSIATNRVVIAATVLALASAMPLRAASAEDGMALPSHVDVPASLKAALLRGDFTAKIMARQGYKGPLMFGHVTARKPAAQLPATASGPHDFYPADVFYYGGPVVASAGHINLYWGETNGSTWGNPSNYQASLNASKMIEMLDAYTGDAALSNGQYPALSIFWYGGNPGTLLYTSQIAAEVQNIATYDRANRGQSLGYTDIYHVFLPPGTDTCFDNAADGCYNPDGAAPGPFAFCGYHTYTQLGDGTVVLFTVEPYQSVSGCSTGTTTVNDTANVLGHEIAETITDPIPGDGWVGGWTLNYGQEIADECAWTLYTHKLLRTNYYTQDWYSNKYHACGSAP